MCSSDLDVKHRFTLFRIERREQIHSTTVDSSSRVTVTRENEPTVNLLDRHTFRQIPRLVDVAPTADRDVIREQLEWNRHDDGRQQR